jgi:phenylpropionate dioxygenase-like ring-hydroxylating dioxygenase large terminal subunit
LGAGNSFPSPSRPAWVEIDLQRLRRNFQLINRDKPPGLQILSVFPSFVLQQTRNSLAVRRLVPQGLDKTELVWTCFGFASDDAEMTERRLRQANLIGPAGYISMEDGAAPGFVQRAVATAADVLSVVEMGGASVASDDNRVTEAAVRGFWKAYRGYMGI